MPIILKFVFALSIWIMTSGYSISDDSQLIVEHTTPNGHSFQYVNLPDEEEISIAIAWPNNIMLSAEMNSVIPHVALDLMLSGGAAGISPADIAANFQDLNSSAFLYSTPGFIRGLILTDAENLDGVVSMASKVLAQPDLAENWLERIKGNIQTGVEESLQHADFTAGNIVRRVVLGEHPIEDFWSTPVDKISSITRAQVADWLESSFVTDGILISASGASEPEIIAAAIDAILSGLPAKATEYEALPITFNISGKTIVLLDKTATDAFVMMVGSIPNVQAQKDFHAVIALYVLGQSDQSRLFTSIREEQRATYEFGSGMIDFVRHERLMIMAGQIDANEITKTLETINSTYENFRLNGISQEEFTQTQSIIEDSFKENMRVPSIVSNALIENQIDNLTLHSLTDISAPLEQLDQAQINDYILNDFPPASDLLRIIVVSNASNISADCIITSIDELQKCE